MEKKIQELDEKLKAGENLLRERELRLRELQNRLDLVHSSFSWRITAPVRRFAEWLSRMIGVPAPSGRPATGKDVSYAEWISRYDTLSDTDLRGITAHIETFLATPLISILMPVHGLREEMLRPVMDSVLNQLYSNWELCMAADASTATAVRKALEEYQLLDGRIKVAICTDTAEAPVALNSALELACGDFTALLGSDGELAPHALYMVVNELNHFPDADIVYSDEDSIDERGRRFQPFFKPDWNPDLFYSQNYLSHVSVYRTALLRSAGGFRSGYGDLHDYDLALRCVLKSDASRIRHLPMVLCHRRAIGGKMVQAEEEKKRRDHFAVKALEEHFPSSLPRPSVSRGPLPETCAITHPLPVEEPLVSLVIPTRNGREVLERCINSIREKTSYKNYEIIIVDNRSEDPGTISYLKRLAEAGEARLLSFDQPFNYPAINNLGVSHAKGELVGLLNNDLEVISPQWLTEMVRHALRPGIGAVGAKLYYPGNTVQHGGVILGLRGIAGHAHLGTPRQQIGYWGRLVLAHNLSAVTAACMVVRRQLYLDAGGLDELNLPVAYNDVDFCLRLQEMGYRNLWTPLAELYHYESYSRGHEDTAEKRLRLQQESDYMVQRWGDLLYNDPAYNPNLTLDWTDFGLACPPRVKKPWIN